MDANSALKTHKPSACRFSELIPEVFKAEPNAEIFATQELDDRLKLVSLFPGHADLAILDLTLHLGIKTFDCLNDFLGLVALQALFEVNFLTRVTKWRNRRILSFDVAEINVPFRESSDHDFHQRF